MGRRGAAGGRREIIISEQTLWEDTAGAFLSSHFREKQEVDATHSVHKQVQQKTVFKHPSPAAAPPPPASCQSHSRRRHPGPDSNHLPVFPSAAPLTGFNQR